MAELKRITGQMLPAKTKDLGNGVVEVVVSTDSLDYHGERLDIKGLNIKDYSGVVLFGHDYESLPIGKSVYLRKKTDGTKNYLVSRTQFAVDEYPFANTVYKMVKGGYMPDVSIGFQPEAFDQDTMTWTKSSMIEYSHVPIGANKEAKVVTAKAFEAAGISAEEFNTQFKEAVQKSVELKDLEEEETVETTEVTEVIEVTEGPVSEETETEIEAITEAEAEIKELALQPLTMDNLVNLAQVLKSATLAFEHIVAQATSETSQKPVKKRVVLVKAKKAAVVVDKSVELALQELNSRLSK